MPRSRRRHLLVGAAFVLAGLVFVLALLGVAGWRVVASESGTRWLLSQVSGLTITGLRGSLQGGPLSAARVAFGVKGSPVQVVADGVSWRSLGWRWRPYPGAWTGLVLDGLRAQRIEIHTGPGNGSPGAAPQQLRLPLEVELRDAQVRALVIDDLPPLRELVLDAHLGAEHGALHRINRVAFGWDRLQLQATGQLRSDAPLALQAHASLQSAPQPGGPAAVHQPWSADLTANGPLARFTVAGSLRPAGDGPASLDVRSVLTPFANWPLAELQADLHELDLAALASAAPGTRLSGHAAVRSSGLALPADVDLQLTNTLPGRWDEQRLPLRSLALQLSATPNKASDITLRRFDLQLGNAAQPAGRWQGEGRWADGQLSLRSRISALQPAQIDGRAAAMTLTGPLDLDWQQKDGGWHAEVDTTLDGRLAGNQTPAVRLLLQGSAEAAAGAGLRLVVKHLQASAGPAHAEASGEALQAVDGHWQVKSDGRLREFDPLLWWPGATDPAWRAGPHRLNAHWQAALRLPTPRADSRTSVPALAQQLAALRGQATVTLDDSRLAGVPLQGRLQWTADDKTPLAVLDADVHAAGNRLLAQAGLGLGNDGRNDHWQVDLQAATLPTLAPLLRLVPALAPWAPQAGQLQLQARADGRWPALRSEGRWRLSELRAGALGIGQASANWRVGGGLDAPLQAEVDMQRIHLGQQAADSMHGTLAGSLRSHQLGLQADTAARPPAWTEPLLGKGGAGRGSAWRLQASGAWQPDAAGGGRWAGRLQQLRGGPSGTTTAWLSADGLDAALQLDADLRPRQAVVQPGRLQLLGAALRWTDLRWQAGAATGSPPRMAIQAELEPLKLAPLLAQIQPDFGWAGDLVVAGHAHIDNSSQFVADVVLERRSGDLSVTDEGGTTALGLSDLRVALEARDGVWHFTEALAGTTVGVLAGAQSVRTTPEAVWPPPQTPLEGVVELRVDNLGVWGPWTPAGWRLTGLLHSSAAIGGRFGAPEYTGTLEGSGLGARNLLQGVNVRDGELRVALRGPTAQIERFNFKGGDGTLTLTGGASFGETPTAQLTLAARRFQLLGRVDRRIVGSGDAQLRLKADAMQLDGRFTVDDGLIDFSRGNAPTLDDDVSVIHRGAAQVATGAPGPETDEDDTPVAPPKPQRQLAMTLDVDLGERLKIKGRGLDAFLRGQLRLTTPGGRLAVNGAVRTESGTYTAYGQNLEVERGLVVFNGPVENPRLDIIALHPNLDVRVGVAVSGTALKQRVRLFSDPEMSDMDKMSWLVLGRAPEGLGRGDAALLQRAAMALLSGENESATNRMMRRLGLDNLSLRQSGEGDLNTTVVGLGKQLSRRWYVGYERSVNSTTGTWQLIYRLAQRVTIRAQGGQDNAVDTIWTWRWR
jgi:translocation and assembly module TamB